MNQEVSKAIKEDRKRLIKEVRKIMLPVPNPYGKWVSVENVNKKVLGKVLSILKEELQELKK